MIFSLHSFVHPSWRLFIFHDFHTCFILISWSQFSSFIAGVGRCFFFSLLWLFQYLHIHRFKGGSMKSMWGRSLLVFCVAYLAELRYQIFYPFFCNIYIFRLSSHHFYSNLPLPLIPQLIKFIQTWPHSF